MNDILRAAGSNISQVAEGVLSLVDVSNKLQVARMIYHELLGVIYHGFLGVISHQLLGVIYHGLLGVIHHYLKCTIYHGKVVVMFAGSVVENYIPPAVWSDLSRVAGGCFFIG